MIKHGHARHGGKRSRAYEAWCHMKRRCYSKSDKRYARYGGRGITVCPRWRESFTAFLADMGEPPAGKSLDRRDNDGNYEPDNCRWSTPKEQAANRDSRGGRPRLTPEAVADIRNTVGSTTLLANRYGVDRSTIKRARGRFWRHV